MGLSLHSTGVVKLSANDNWEQGGVLVGGDSVVTAPKFDALGSRDERAVGIEGEPMGQRGTVEAAAPARTDRPLRQIVVFLCFTYAMALALALALPRAGIAPLISIAVPVIAVALTVAFTVPKGGRREIWATSP